MKLPRIILLCVAAALPALVLAKTAPKSTGSTGQTAKPQGDGASLGRLDGLFTVCAAADPSHREIIERYKIELIGKGELRAAGTNTPAFEEAREELLEAASKVSHAELAAQCSRAFSN